MKLLAVIVIVIGFLFFHKGFDQDPLKSFDENIRQGIPPQEKPKELRDAVIRKAMVLDADPSIVRSKKPTLKLAFKASLWCW